VGEVINFLVLSENDTDDKKGRNSKGFGLRTELAKTVSSEVYPRGMG